jgi:hypothetical protein
MKFKIKKYIIRKTTVCQQVTFIKSHASASECSKPNLHNVVTTYQANSIPKAQRLNHENETLYSQDDVLYIRRCNFT